MDISNQIRTRRTAMGLSQDELAQRIHVSRQTISNWETDRTYPDVQSLLLMSNLFGTTIDVLVKGDLEMMKSAVENSANDDAAALSSLGRMMMAGTVVALIVGFAGYALFKPWGLAAGLVPYAFALVAAFRAERIKKDNDVQTYREIVAFMDGAGPEEMDELRAHGRAPSRLRAETAVKLLAGAGAGAVVAAVVFALIRLLGL